MPRHDYSQTQALTFDCYGTLIDWESGLLATLRPWAEREQLSKATDAALLTAYSQIEPAVQSETPNAPYPEILREVMHRIARHFKARVTNGDAEALGNSVGDWPAFVDSPEALARLKQRFKLVIVSNVDRASFARSNALLGVEFDAVVTAEDVGSYKPRMAHFHRAIESLGEVGVDASQVIHVAESLYHDHVPAKSLGLRTAWISRRAGEPGSRATRVPDSPVIPDLIFPTLKAFADAAL